MFQEAGIVLDNIHPLWNLFLERRDFAQLEDFNAKKKDDEYQKAYFENLNKKTKIIKTDKPQPNTEEQQLKPKVKEISTDQFDKLMKEARDKLTSEDIALANSRWEDTEQTTRMWEIVSQKKIAELQNWLLLDPSAAFIRSSDGRGPMWWAYENRNMPVAVLLTKMGVRNDLKDKDGKTPLDMLA